MEEITQEEVNKLWARKYITQSEAGRLAGVDRQGIAYYISRGELERIAHGSRIYVDTTELRILLTKRRKSLLDRLAAIRLST